MAYYYKQGKKVELKDVLEGFSFGNDWKCNCGIGIILLVILLVILLCGFGCYVYKNKKR